MPRAITGEPVRSACVLCRRPVDIGDDLVREVVGLEDISPVPSRRGGSDIVLRRPTGGVAHRDCMVRVKAGLSPAQETLV